MGMDVDAQTGVLVPLKTFLKSLSDEQVLQLPERIERCLNNNEERVACLGPIKLGKSPTKSEILKSLYKLVKSRTSYEDTKYGQADLEDAEELCDLLNAIFFDATELYGFIDKTGQWAIPSQFEFAGDFREGLADARLDGQEGFIDKAGQWVIPPQFECACSFHEGLAVVVAGDPERYGIIDKRGRWVVAPDCESLDEEFSEGLIWARKDGLYGFINESGEWAIPACFESAEPFSEGLAEVMRDSRVGFIDKAGSWVISPRFESTRSFVNGLAGAQEDGQWGLIDGKGRWIVPPELEGVGPGWIGSGLTAVKKGGLWGYVDRTGQWIVPPQFEEIDWSDGELISVKKDGLWGFIDNTGQWRIPPQFEHAKRFSEGLAGVEKDGLWGFIDETGRFMLPPRFGEVRPFAGGFAMIFEGGLLAKFMDRKGNIVTASGYQIQGDFSEGLAVASVSLGLVPRLPAIEEIEVFGSPRHSGNYDVQRGEPYLRFSADDCFERILSPAGKELASQLKQDDLQLSEWSSVSF